MELQNHEIEKRNIILTILCICIVALLLIISSNTEEENDSIPTVIQTVDKSLDHSARSGLFHTIKQN